MILPAWLLYSQGMNQLYYPLLAFIAGAAIAAQAGLNAQLGSLLRNALAASVIAFLASFLITVTALLVSQRGQLKQVFSTEVPSHLWYAGGLLSAMAICSFYWLIPRMGVGQMLSYSLTGQLGLALIAGHFGWFGLPHSPMDGVKILGLFAMVTGIILINRSG